MSIYLFTFIYIFNFISTELVNVGVSSENVQISPQIFYRLLRHKYEEDIKRDQVCDNTTCYAIADYLFQLGYIPYIYRAMLLQDAKEAEFSGAILKTPTDKTLNALDSSKWEIDHQWLASGPYEGTFGNAIFWALDIPDDKKDLEMNILMIGLGGGTFSSHTAWKYPKVNLTIVELSPLITKLAVDWFGIKDDERHRVIVNDGAEYLKEALYRGERFDAILLDATYSNRNNYITAPVKEFLDEDVIKNMGLLLGKDGILVSNVVFGELKEVDEAKGMQFIIDLFGTEFSHTEIYTIYGPGFNYVLLARQKPMKNISSMIQLQKYGPY